MKLNQITLPTLDIAQSVAFYRRMGFEQIVSSVHYARFRATQGDTTFSLHQVDVPQGEASPGSATVIYFECDELDRKVAQLAACGFVFSQLPRDETWLWREARLHDPSGNEICLYHAGESRLNPPWRLGGQTLDVKRGPPDDQLTRLPTGGEVSRRGTDFSPFQCDPVLLTPRLRLRRLCERDLPDMLAIHRLPEVNRYIPYLDWRGMADARQWFAKVRQRHSEGSGLHLAMTYPAESERVIGATLLFGFDKEHGLAEIGYAMGTPHCGQGFMREAVAATICHAFETLGVRRLEAVVDGRNKPSHKLLLASGFVHEGFRPQKYVTKGEPTDMNVYGLLRSQWQRQ